jgi:zinc transporter, ZIP family
MLEALGWGAVAASSLLIGALVGLLRPWPTRAIGLVLGFGAGGDRLGHRDAWRGPLAP